MPIEVFPDSQLPNDASKGCPVIYGNTKAAIWFHEFMGYQFAVSEHFAFNKNQTTMRVIEGFDVTQADAEDATYCYGHLKAAAAPTG